MKKKLGADLPPYLILGACHAPSALKALTAAPEVGVLLPCNVTVSVEGGRTVIRAMDPRSVLGLVGRPGARARRPRGLGRAQRVVANAAGD